MVRLSTSKETGATVRNAIRSTIPTRKPIPAGFKAQPRDTATRPSPMTSASIANAARKSSIVGVNPADPMSVYSCAKT